jgi:hypothetical protein
MIFPTGRSRIDTKILKGLNTMKLINKAISVVPMVLTLAVLLFLVSCKEKPAGFLYWVGVENSADAVKDKSCLVIAVHGWIKKGKGGWPEKMAKAMHERVDSNDWLFGYFEWSKGAKTLNPKDAVKFARDIAGPQLAREILKSGKDFRHIHLLGHSSGCWAVSEAAKELARQTKADIHITFFDAYVPMSDQPDSLADVNTAEGVNLWAEHYYTRDYTLSVTEQDLKFAHNIDLTKLDGLVKDHNFPWQWYLATVRGHYSKSAIMNKGQPNKTFGGVEYGFARSRQCGDANGW